MAAMKAIPEAGTPDLSMPRFEDGAINLQELFRRMAEDIVNGVMAAEADQMCEAAGSSRNGYRDRRLETCAGTLALRVPKLRSGSFFPEDVIERYQRVDRAVVAAVAEMYRTGTSTRKVQAVAEKLDIARLSKDQVSAICGSLDADAAELLGRDLSGLDMPYVWLGAAYVRRRRDGRAASTAVVTAIGCDSEDSRHVLGLGVVDAESYDSWLSFLHKVRGHGVSGVRLVTSDAHEGFRRTISEEFQGAAWQRRVVHLVRGCCREARLKQLRKRVARIASAAFRLRDPAVVRAAYHVACEMFAECRPGAARVMEEAEPDAPAYLDFPPSRRKRLRTNNLQERTNREIKRRSRVVQVFPSEKSLERLIGTVLCEVDEGQWRRAASRKTRWPSPTPTSRRRSPWGKRPSQS